LIETELEMKKVSWPTGAEARNATWIVVLVTIILTASLAFFDIALVSVFKFFFETGGG
jgi:preprotein translocase SecE subunit